MDPFMMDRITADRVDHRSPMECFFSPSSVAVVGATDREGSVGRTVLANLLSDLFSAEMARTVDRQRTPMSPNTTHSLTTLSASLSSRKTVNFACRRWSTSVHSRTPACLAS